MPFIQTTSQMFYDVEWNFQDWEETCAVFSTIGEDLLITPRLIRYWETAQGIITFPALPFNEKIDSSALMNPWGLFPPTATWLAGEGHRFPIYRAYEFSEDRISKQTLYSPPRASATQTLSLLYLFIKLSLLAQDEIESVSEIARLKKNQPPLCSPNMKMNCARNVW